MLRNGKNEQAKMKLVEFNNRMFERQRMIEGKLEDVY